MLRLLITALILSLGLAGCAPLTQSADPVPAGFSGPRLERDDFVSFDGARLGLNHWRASGGEPKIVFVAVHGMNDYAQAYWMAGPWWARHGVTTYAYDQRGFGRSPGRGVWGGRRLMSEDLRTLCALVRSRHPHAVIAVVGESMGGAVAIEAFASTRPPDADRLVLLAPAVWGWSTQPIVNRLALWAAAHLTPGLVLDPPAILVARFTASDNDAELLRLGRDPQMVWGTRPDAVYGLMNLMDRAQSDIARVKAPIFYGYGVHDQLIPSDPTRLTVARLKPSDRTALYPHGWHLLLRDYGAEQVWADVLAFARDPAAPLPSGARPIPADFANGGR